MQALRSSTQARAFAPATASSSARRGAAVVVRVKPTKAADYRTLSPEELMQGVASLKAEYTKLQYLKRTRGKVTNPETLQVRARENRAPGDAETAMGCVRGQAGGCSGRQVHCCVCAAVVCGAVSVAAAASRSQAHSRTERVSDVVGTIHCILADRGSRRSCGGCYRMMVARFGGGSGGSGSGSVAAALAPTAAGVALWPAQAQQPAQSQPFPPPSPPPQPPTPPLPVQQESSDDGVAPKGNEFKHVRRQIAQMLTVLREKQLADGVDRRAARKLAREASVMAGMGGR